MLADPSTLPQTKLLAETEPPKILPRILKRFDLVTIYFSVIFGAYGAGQMAAQGWAGIPMLVLATVTFLVPCALASYELGTLFPSEGGIYVWAHKIFGPVHGFIAGWLSWMPIFLLLPLDAAVIASHMQFALGQQWGLLVQIILQLVYVWLVFCLTAFRLRISQTVINIFFFVAIGTAIMALIAGLVHLPAANPINSEIFSFDLNKYGFLYSAAVLWLLGVEVPFNLGAEYSEHKRTGKTMLIWGSFVIVIGYIMGIVGILLTTSIGQIDQTTGVARAVATLSPLAGQIVAFAICFAVFAQETSAMNAYSRLPFIGGIEKHAPQALAHVSIHGRTPWRAMFVQAIGASVVILIFATQTSLNVTFNLYLAALVAVWCASLFYIYFGVLRSRHLYQNLYKERGEQVWKIPGGKIGLWLCTSVGIIFNALAIYYVYAKPWVDGILVENWRLWLGITSLAIVAIGIIIYVHSTQKQYCCTPPTI